MNQNSLFYESVLANNSCLGLFVVVSWISFVVPPDVIPGRMALLITLFLVLVNIFNTVTTNTPKAEGILYAFTFKAAFFAFKANFQCKKLTHDTFKDHVNL